MKKLSVVALTLLLLLASGLFVIPNLMDWSRFKAPLAEALSAACGRPVALAGDVRFSVLPTPAFSATEIAVANPPGAAEPRLLHLGRLDARVALLPLLAGRIEINTIVLDHPTLVLETLADGRRGWLPGAGGPSSTAPPILRLDRIDVTNGTMVWQDDAAGTAIRLTAIQGRLDAGSLAGPFDVRGQAAIQGIPARLDATVGSLGADGAMPVRLALALSDGSARLHFAGLATTGPALRLQGDGRIEAAHPARLLSQLTTALGAPMATGGLPPALDQPLSARTALDAGAAGITLTGMDLDLGGTKAAGSARFSPGTPPAFELHLATPRLDLAPWLVGNATAADLAGLRLPLGASLRLDLAADALALGHEGLHQARLALRLADGTLTVERLTALGPGGSELTIAGSLVRTDDQPVVDATVEADTDNLRLLLDALGLGGSLDADALPADRLRRVSLIARLRGRPDDFQITGTDLRIDTTRVKGGIAYRNHGRPAFGVRLALDHLDLDAYRDPNHPPGGAQADSRRPGEPWPGGPWLDVLHRGLGVALTRADVNLEAHLGHLVVDGLAMRDLDLDLTADHGALTIRRAQVAELAGIAAQLHGKLAGLAPMRGADLDFAAEIGSAAALERLSGAALPQSLHRLGAFKLTGHAAGDGERLGLALTAEGAGGRIAFTGALAPAARRLAEPIQIHAVFPETGPIIRLFAPNYQTETGDEPGATDLSGALAGDTGRLHLTGLAGTVAGITLQGRIDADLTGPQPSLDARLQAGEIVLDRLLPASEAPAPRHWFTLWPRAAAPESRHWSTDPLPLAWLAAVDGRLVLDAAGLTVGNRRLGAPAVRATLSGGTLRLEQFDGELMQGRFSTVGRLATQTTGAAPGTDAGTATVTADAALTMTLVGARIERGLLYAGTVPHAVDVTTGTLNVDLDVKARGDSEETLIRSLGGTGQMAIRDGRLQGIDLPDLDRRLAAIQRPQDAVGLLTPGGLDEADGETPFDRLTGSVTVDHGIAATNDLTLAAQSGTGETQGFVDLPNRVLNLTMHVRVPHNPPLPIIGVTLGGTLDHPHRGIDTRELQSYVAQRFTAALAPKPAAPGAVGPGEFLRNLFRSPTPSPSPTP